MNSRSRHMAMRARRLAGRARARLRRVRQQPAGRAPDVVWESTNLGPDLDAVVHRARSRMRVGVDGDHDLVHDNLDALHVLLQERELLSRPHVDLVDHFLETGVERLTSPHPDFSMTNYLRRHPEAAASGERSPYLHWLKRGRAAGELADPVPMLDEVAPVLGLETQELLDLVVQRRHDLLQRLRTGTLGEMMAKASEIEPLIGAAWPAITRPMLMPLTSDAVMGGIAALHRAHDQADLRRARVVLVVNQARRASDPGLEGHLTQALAASVDPGEIVVIHTDESTGSPVRRHPDGVREIDFARLAQELLPEEEDAHQVLVTLIRSLQADSVVNVRSRMLFQAMRTYGLALAASERLFLCLSGNVRTPMGQWDGWGPHYFYRTFDHITGLITDNAAYAEQLHETYRVPPDERRRIHLLRTPVDPDVEPVPAPPDGAGRRPQLFWAGRWDRQRRVELLLELARRMPDVDVRAWGNGPLRPADAADVPPNVRLEGPFDDVSELPLDEADLWLHTAAWDAVPTQLLDVGVRGIPVVGTVVGGTGEVIGEEDAWPVPDGGGVEAYEQAVRAVLDDVAGARSRAARLRDRLLRERAPEHFRTQVADLLLVDEPRRADA